MIPPTSSSWCCVRGERRFLAIVAVALSCSVMIMMAGCGSGEGGDAENGSSEAESAAIKESSVETALDAAHQYFMTGDLDKARAVLARLVETAPEDPRPHELFGQVLIAEARAALQQGDAEAADQWRQQAADHYEKAVEGNPEEPGLHHSAGMIYYEAGRVEDALASFRTATELDPLNPQYPLFAAQLLINDGDFDAAEEMLDRVLALDPDLAIGHASMAIVLTNRQEFDGAMSAIAEARALEPRRLDFRVQEARIHRLRGEPARSAELLAPLSQGDRSQLLCAEELALAYEALQEFSLAESAWIAAYHAAPNQPESWLAAEGVARSRLERGDREDALFWVNQARRLGSAEVAARLDALEHEIRTTIK